MEQWKGGNPSWAYPTGWNYSAGHDSNGYLNHTVEWTDEVAYSGNRSLKISTYKLDSENTASWSYELSRDLPVGQDITLEAKIKGNLVGQGASLLIRADDVYTAVGDPEQYATTQGNTPITGIFDWTIYLVVLKDLGLNVKSITVYLEFLPNTTGEVFFDDISIK